MLQHYLTTIGLDRAEPILYLPFGAFNFFSSDTEGHLTYIREYWHAIREHLDQKLRDQGDLYMVEDSVPDGPELDSLPPLPVPPVDPATLKITDLEIWVLFTTNPFTEVGLEIQEGDQAFVATFTTAADRRSQVGITERISHSLQAKRFRRPRSLVSASVSAVSLPQRRRLQRPHHEGQAVARLDLLKNLNNTIIIGTAKIKQGASNPVKVVDWNPTPATRTSSGCTTKKEFYDGAVAVTSPSRPLGRNW